MSRVQQRPQALEVVAEAIPEELRIRSQWVRWRYALCSADPYTGIDLDSCRDPENGEIEP